MKTGKISEIHDGFVCTNKSNPDLQEVRGVFVVLTCGENVLHGALANENKATLCEKVKIQERRMCVSYSDLRCRHSNMQSS